jgi:hypothetical protein
MVVFGCILGPLVGTISALCRYKWRLVQRSRIMARYRRRARALTATGSPVGLDLTDLDRLSTVPGQLEKTLLFTLARGADTLLIEPLGGTSRAVARVNNVHEEWQPIPVPITDIAKRFAAICLPVNEQPGRRLRVQVGERQADIRIFQEGACENYRALLQFPGDALTAQQAECILRDYQYYVVGDPWAKGYCELTLSRSETETALDAQVETTGEAVLLHLVFRGRPIRYGLVRCPIWILLDGVEVARGNNHHGLDCLTTVALGNHVIQLTWETVSVRLTEDMTVWKGPPIRVCASEPGAYEITFLRSHFQYNGVSSVKTPHCREMNEQEVERLLSNGLTTAMQ